LTYFAELGYPVVDSDAVARAVVAPGTAGLAAVAAAFGPGAMRDDGSLDRAALGRTVFNDPEARRRLEAITHPLIQAESRRLADLARAQDAPAIVVDIPLLVETGQADDFDLVLAVAAPEELRLARLAQRGLTPDQAKARLAAQVTDTERAAAAQVVLDGSGTVAALRQQIDRLAPLLTRDASGGRGRVA
jgi:dephospho-CoA kinase